MLQQPTEAKINQKRSLVDERNPNERFFQKACNYFSEFAENTGIHGFKYVGDQKRPLIERLWWIFFFSISLFMCVHLIIEILIKWDQYPVLVSFARSPTPVRQIPFPAITICSETKIRQRHYNFTDAFHKASNQSYRMSREELQNFSTAALFCDKNSYGNGNKTTDSKAIEYLIKLAPQMEEVFFECKWTSNNTPCKELFTPMLTEDGYCFTFNMLDRRDIYTDIIHVSPDYLGRGKTSEHWSLENGYDRYSKSETFPRRTSSSGASAGLFVTLKAYWQDVDFICRGPVQGYKLFLHHPAEIPGVSGLYLRAPYNQEVIVSVKPDMMTTSEGLRSYESHRRQCFFQRERKLYFYKTYTQQNCQVECLANFTLTHCGCVSFHMPRENTTKICGSGNTACIHRATKNLLAQQVETELTHSTTYCHCLPACTSITYNAETSHAVYNWSTYYDNLKKNFSNIPGLQLTRIGIFFKEMQFITSERNELYGLTDFLANCGGLLGLFTGFSFLSIFEITYFLSLRLMCNIFRYGKHFWSGANIQ